MNPGRRPQAKRPTPHQGDVVEWNWPDGAAQSGCPVLDGIRNYVHCMSCFGSPGSQMAVSFFKPQEMVFVLLVWLSFKTTKPVGTLKKRTKKQNTKQTNSFFSSRAPD